MEETRTVAAKDWPETCKQLHREGYSVRQMVPSDDGETLTVTVEKRYEVRVEQPDTHSGSSRGIAL